MTQEERIGELVRATLQTSEFQPCAFFDEDLDCIRVITRDCSTTEIRVNELFTVLENNYPSGDDEQVVGFTIKGARHFCQTNGFSLSAPVRIAQILDVIVAKSPDPVVRLIVRRVARPLVATGAIRDAELRLSPAA